MHTGGRSAADIDAGGVLGSYGGVIVRDGYAGYRHLTDALHAWCGAHNLRDLRDLYTFDPTGRSGPGPWPTCSSTPTPPRPPPAPPASPGLGEEQLAQISAWYRGAVTKGITGNQGKRSKTARDGLRLARRFRDHQDMILRFATDLAVGFTSNQAERDVRPVKVQQRSSGGCWRTLDGLADFAIVQSYLSTAAKWGLSKLDALRQLFTTGPWLPPATAPP
jgi:transposase